MPADFSVQERGQSIELLRDGRLRSEFQKDLLYDFWQKRRSEYGLISDRALKFLIPFSTTYPFETEFSAILRLKVTKIKPDIAKLCKVKQAPEARFSYAD